MGPSRRKPTHSCPWARGAVRVEPESLDIALCGDPTVIGCEFDPAMVRQAGNHHAVVTIFALASF